MSNDKYSLRVFPNLPETPAGKVAMVIELASSTPVYDDEDNVVEWLPPVLTPDEALRILDTTSASDKK